MDLISYSRNPFGDSLDQKTWSSTAASVSIGEKSNILPRRIILPLTIKSDLCNPTPFSVCHPLRKITNGNFPFGVVLIAVRNRHWVL
ncbi:hypothetical protein CEXT_123711 [Caerostris extrusa]|uniref:Uncharacterized protein n=1 Tax=Caerostris extrusa TaxID=172846 RepID=A0AAV4UYN6_CAEEX|nr:hypothetical protein CEXT_123711 [Caerostris extrusa]